MFTHYGSNLGTWDGTGEAEPWEVVPSGEGSKLVGGKSAQIPLRCDGFRPYYGEGEDLFFSLSPTDLAKQMNAKGYNTVAA